MHDLLDAEVDVGGRIAFVAGTPDSDGGVGAEAEDFFADVGEVAFGVVGVGAVGGVGLEHFVPDEEAVLVAEVVEIVGGGLTDPVAEDGVVGECVHADLGFEAIAWGAFHGFVDAPVAALGDDGDAVDGEGEVVGAGDVVGDFADAEVGVEGIGGGVLGGAGEVEGVEILWAVAVGPPELRVVEVELGEVFWREGEEAGFVGVELEGGVEGGGGEGGGEGGGLVGVGEVVEGGGEGEVGAVGAREGEVGGDEGIFDADGAGLGEVDVLPEADVAVADAGDPVPADGAEEGGAVLREDAAVGTGAVGESLFDGRAGVGRGEDVDGEGGGFSRGDVWGDVEIAAGEGAANGGDLFAVDPEVGDVVNAVEVEPEVAVGGERWGGELGAIPPGSAGEGVGDFVGAVVFAEERFGEGAVGDERGEDGAGDDGVVPVGGGEGRGGELFGGSVEFGGVLEEPVGGEGCGGREGDWGGSSVRGCARGKQRGDEEGRK